MFGRRSGGYSAIERFLLGSDEINARETLARQQAAQAALQKAIMARSMPQAYNGMAGPTTDGSEPAASVVPPDQRRRGVPTLRDVSSEVFNLIGTGADARQYVDALDKMSPDIMNINGWGVDRRDGSNAGAYFEEAPGKGMRPDPASGGWMNSPGTLRSLGEQAAATAAAEAAGKAPWDFINVPTPSGAPRTISKAQAAGGDFTGMSPADNIRANAEATGEAERAQALQNRASAATRQLQVLDNMEGLLPDVVAGFGSDARLQGYRALSLAGNQDATRKVRATETFLNQGRQLVADIIKTFGANPTEGERKYAEKMSGADADLNPETLREGIRLQRERIYRDLQAAQAGPRMGGGFSQPRQGGVRMSGQGFKILEVLP